MTESSFESKCTGIWRRVQSIGEFKFGIKVLHLHPNGRAAVILYSFRPFHDLDSMGPSFGHWKPVDGATAVLKLDEEEAGFKLKFIPDRQLLVQFLAGREVYERATAEEISVKHLKLISGVDFNEQIYSWLEQGNKA